MFVFSLLHFPALSSCRRARRGGRRFMARRVHSGPRTRPTARRLCRSRRMRTTIPATRCSKRPDPGMTALVERGSSANADICWGAYRCEKWGKGSASLHAEGRAVDWALDVTCPRSARGRSPDRPAAGAGPAGRAAQALARRVGVEEIIWDCGYWGAGMDQARPYSACLSKRGKLQAQGRRPVAHRNHLHIGLATKASTATDIISTALSARAAPGRPVAATTPRRRRAGRP